MRDPIKNPLYEAWLPYKDAASTGDFLAIYEARDEAVQKYAWAIPSEEVIRVIASMGPILEVGAGTGYWANLLTQVGARVTCFDSQPPDIMENPYHGSRTWHLVEKGDVQTIPWSKYRDHTLLLCWPPYGKPLAYDCLKAFRGTRLFYVGEGYGGCTGDDRFHEELSRSWTCEANLVIPQWFGIHDSVFLYTRK